MCLSECMQLAALDLGYATLLVGCLQSLDWTGLDWTTGLSLKLRACQYINTYNVFVQLINGAYS